MAPRHAARLLPVLAMLLLAMAAMLPLGCETKPEAPVWDNPFDPEHDGDPFNVQAFVGHNAVIVSWTRPGIAAIKEYEVYRSLDGVNFTRVAQPTASATSYTDTGFSPNEINFYKVAVVNPAGEVSAISRVVAATLLTAPWLEMAGGAPTIASRSTFVIARTAYGDTLELAANPEFTGAMRLPAHPGLSDTIAWDAGPADSNGVSKGVWLRVFTGEAVSRTAADSVTTSFRPTLALTGDNLRLATRRQTVVISAAAGITQMRFALAAGDLAAAPWVSPDSMAGTDAYFTGDLLGADTTAQWLHAEAGCDFGYSAFESLECVPDNLDSARFVIAGGDTIGSDIVSLVASAVATEMRFAENPDSLATTPWQAYADTSAFTLSAGTGTRTVFGQFRNDWYDTLVWDSVFKVQTAPRSRR